MATVTYSAMARADMVELWVWIATKSGAETADTITDRIERRIAMLGDNPMTGSDETRRLIGGWREEARQWCRTHQGAH